MYCFSDNVEKELKFNQYIFISLTDSHASHPKEQCCSVETASKAWRYFGDNLVAPVQSVFCASTSQPKVTPRNHHFLINIHHIRFSLGHQGLPRIPRSLEKPPASTPQEGVRGMLKEEEEKKSKVPFGVKNEVFPTVA